MNSRQKKWWRRLNQVVDMVTARVSGFPEETVRTLRLEHAERGQSATWTATLVPHQKALVAMRAAILARMVWKHQHEAKGWQPPADLSATVPVAEVDRIAEIFFGTRQFGLDWAETRAAIESVLELLPDNSKTPVMKFDDWRLGSQAPGGVPANQWRMPVPVSPEVKIEWTTTTTDSLKIG